jgi:phosphotransferase system IIB component
MSFLSRLFKKKQTIRKIVPAKPVIETTNIAEDNSKLEEFKKALENLEVVQVIFGKSKVDVDAIDKQLGIGRTRKPVK